MPSEQACPQLGLFSAELNAKLAHPLPAVRTHSFRPPRSSRVTESIDTYFAAWNETAAGARRALLERCLTGDVELIDENGRFWGYDGLGDLIARFHEQVPGGRVVKSSGIDQFAGIARYSWDIVDRNGNTVMVGLDVVEQDTDGRLRRIIMFHHPLPALN